MGLPVNAPHEADARDAACEAGDCETQPFVGRPSPQRRPLVQMLISLAATTALAIAAASFWRSAPAAARLSSSIEFDIQGLPADEQVDFYVFAHVDNSSLLPDILTYPLKNLVAGDGPKGILVMYLMSATEFKMLLDHINELANNPGAQLPEELVTLHKTVRKHMKAANADLHPVDRVRILTPYDFKGSLLSVRSRVGEKRFAEWFGHTTYDAPKFADALLRLRSLGNDIPVFRFDVDVLFNEYTKSDISSIKRAVVQGMSDFKSCVDDPFVQDFLVSQQYGGVPASRSQEFKAWSEAYSTRANPALLATPGTTNASQWKPDGGWGSFNPSPEVLQQATDEHVMMAFYGVQKNESQELLQPTTPSSADSPEQRASEDILKLGNAYIGANPSRAIISGAALALGPGISVDFPPFLHTDLNIMWIDDHLLDRLTQEVSGTKRSPRPAGVGTARVVKARGNPVNVAKYTLEVYMPTLMYGILMDAWVNNHPSSYLLKYAPKDIPKTEAIEQVYAELMAPKAQGPWSDAVERVRKAGRMLSEGEVQVLVDDLWTASYERIKDVYWQWSKLPKGRVDNVNVSSFATLWGTGRICRNQNLKNYCDNPAFEKLGQGLVTPDWDKLAKASAGRPDLPALARSDINPALAEKVDQLIDGAVSHLRWMLTWPDVVQAIRDEKFGKVPSDTTYSNAPPIPELGTKHSRAGRTGHALALLSTIFSFAVAFAAS